jgi:hypothetical protein
MLPIFSGCLAFTDTCRQQYGISLIQFNSGSGFLTGSNPHDRCLYEAFYFGGSQCPF